MTKFREFDEDQRVVFKELLLRGIDRRIKEDMEYTGHVFRFLVLGNGAGIALLASFMGVVAGRGHPLDALVSPLWKFLLGAVFAALIYAPLMAVSTEATNKVLAEAVQFFKNELDFESMQGWALNKRGQRVVGFLILASFICFIWGVIQCVGILSSLKP